SILRELVKRDRVDVLLADVPPRELLPVYRSGHNTALVVLLDGANAEDTARALSAGARAVLDRSASRNEIIAAKGGYRRACCRPGQPPCDIAPRSTACR